MEIDRGSHLVGVDRDHRCILNVISVFEGAVGLEMCDRRGGDWRRMVWRAEAFRGSWVASKGLGLGTPTGAEFPGKASARRSTRNSLQRNHILIHFILNGTLWLYALSTLSEPQIDITPMYRNPLLMRLVTRII